MVGTVGQYRYELVQQENEHGLPFHWIVTDEHGRSRVLKTPAEMLDLVQEEAAAGRIVPELLVDETAFDRARTDLLKNQRERAVRDLQEQTELLEKAMRDSGRESEIPSMRADMESRIAALKTIDVSGAS